MGVGVNAAWHDQFARGIMNLGPIRNRQIGADGGNLAVFKQNITNEGALGIDDFAALDKNAHDFLSVVSST